MARGREFNRGRKKVPGPPPLARLRRLGEQLKDALDPDKAPGVLKTDFTPEEIAEMEAQYAPNGEEE